MSEITANITVQNVDLTVETTDNNINITPSDVQLSVYSGGYSGNINIINNIGGNTTEIQFNDGGNFGGSSNLTFNKTNNILNLLGNLNATAASITSNSNVGNLFVALGGTANIGASINMNASGGAITTGAGLADGSGILRTIATSNNAYIQAGLDLTVNSAANLVFTTISAGKEWMRLDNNGNLGININAPTSKLHLIGNANIVGNISISGNANLGNIGATNGIFTNISGNGSALSNITGANVTGIVANAAIANTVRDAAQSNITSLGILSNLSVNGTANLSDISNVKILGGNSGQAIVTDGAGNLIFANAIGNSITVPVYNTVTDRDNDLPFPLTGTIVFVSNAITVANTLIPSFMGYTGNYWQMFSSTISRNGNITNAVRLAYNTNLNSNTSISISLSGSNITVYWDDGNSNFYSSGGTASHTYASLGNYQVQITGTLTSIAATGSSSLIAVNDFGNTGLQSMRFNSANLTNVPNAIPNTVTSISNIFFNCSNINDANIISWDTKNITNMSGAFQLATKLTINLPWNTINVTNMSNMFNSASMFRGYGLSTWNTSNVTNMNYMIASTPLFNQNLSGWCVINIPSEPTNFATGSGISANYKPVWGTCP